MWVFFHFIPWGLAGNLSTTVIKVISHHKISFYLSIPFLIVKFCFISLLQSVKGTLHQSQTKPAKPPNFMTIPHQKQKQQ